MNKFFDDVVTGALMDQLAEYSVSGKAISHGSHVGSTVITTPEPPKKSVSDATIRQLRQTKQLGNYTVQLEWSNQAGKCL